VQVLIIANSSIVFGKELRNELLEKAYEVSLLDFASLELLEGNTLNNKFSNVFSKFKKLPKISMLFRMYYILKVIKKGEYDVVNIHYNRWFYKVIMHYFKSTKTKLVISTYGSDFYRASSKIRNRLRSIYKVADAVTFTNIATKEEFVKYYNAFEGKSHICRFGLKTLDFIDKNRELSKEKMQRRLGYDSSKIIVTCGYNATSAQQHFKIIESLEKLDEAFLNRCQFIFPLTYGDASYGEKVIQRVEGSKRNSKVLKDFLYQDDNAFVKLASDVMINILKTDSFSGSMQEFLYAGNVVITGSWLPYKTFDESGIVYEKVDSSEEIALKLKYVIDNLDVLKARTTPNASIIAKLSSWSQNIDSWIKVYEGKKI